MRPDRTTHNYTMMWADEYTTVLVGYRRGARMVVVYQHDEEGFLACFVISHSSGGQCRAIEVAEKDAENAQTAVEAAMPELAQPLRGYPTDGPEDRDNGVLGVSDHFIRNG